MRKRTIFAILALGLLLGLTACGSSSSSDADDSTDSSDSAQLANPMTEVASLEELAEAGDCAMIRPEGVELSDETYYTIDGDDMIYQYGFTVDGTECILRFSKAGSDTDISGIYGDDGLIFDGQGEDPVYVENDDVKAERWFTLDGQYVFAVMDSSSWEYEAFSAIYQQFAAMEPKN